MMSKNGKIWLLFYYDESDNLNYPIGLFDTIQQVMDCVKSRSYNVPFVKHYHLCSIALSDCFNLLYDDNKIMLE